MKARPIQQLFLSLIAITTLVFIYTTINLNPVFASHSGNIFPFNGQDCSQDSDCASGYQWCYSGSCHAETALYGTCTSNSQCDSDWCNGGFCSPPSCSDFDNSCGGCLAQSACAYRGTPGSGSCVSVDPAVGDVCPAGTSQWYWASCNTSDNECSITTPPTASPSPSSGGSGGNDCSQRSSCGACILNAQCAWRGSLSTAGGSCVTDTFNYQCPAGETNLYPASCSAGGNVCAATVYDITGRVTEGSTGIAGAVLCLDPTYPDCSDVTGWKTTTNANGNYTIRDVTNGGSGHNLFLSTSSIGNRVPNSSNTQHIAGSTNADQTVNFTVTTVQGTGNSPATASRVERCSTNGSGWELVAQNVCSNLCSATPTTNNCNSPYICSANPPQPTGCSAVTTPGITCAATGISCWTCVPPVTPSGGPTCGNGVCSGSETCSSCPSDCGTCPPNTPTQPWIQTSGGDVHSNTNIDVP